MTSGRIATFRRNPATRGSAGRHELALLNHPARLRDAKFANGLNIVLDGLATRLPREGRGF